MLICAVLCGWVALQTSTLALLPCGLCRCGWISVVDVRDTLKLLHQRYGLLFALAGNWFHCFDVQVGSVLWLVCMRDFAYDGQMDAVFGGSEVWGFLHGATCDGAVHQSCRWIKSVAHVIRHDPKAVGDLFAVRALVERQKNKRFFSWFPVGQHPAEGRRREVLERCRHKPVTCQIRPSGQQPVNGVDGVIGDVRERAWLRFHDQRLKRAVVLRVLCSITVCVCTVFFFWMRTRSEASKGWRSSPLLCCSLYSCSGCGLSAHRASWSIALERQPRTVFLSNSPRPRINRISGRWWPR